MSRWMVMLEAYFLCGRYSAINSQCTGTEDTSVERLNKSKLDAASSSTIACTQAVAQWKRWPTISDEIKPCPTFPSSYLKIVNLWFFFLNLFLYFYDPCWGIIIYARVIKSWHSITFPSTLFWQKITLLLYSE